MRYAVRSDTRPGFPAYLYEAPGNRPPPTPMQILGTLGVAVLGGLILNVMPCVLPVLTLKAFSLVDHAHRP